MNLRNFFKVAGMLVRREMMLIYQPPIKPTTYIGHRGGYEDGWVTAPSDNYEYLDWRHENFCRLSNRTNHGRVGARPSGDWGRIADED